MDKVGNGYHKRSAGDEKRKLKVGDRVETTNRTTIRDKGKVVGISLGFFDYSVKLDSYENAMAFEEDELKLIEEKANCHES